MTQTEIDRVREMSLAGMSGKAIAAEIGRHRDTVDTAVKQLRADGLLPPKKRLIDTVPEQLVRLIRSNCKNGVNHSTLAERLGCTVEQIRIVRRVDKAARIAADQRVFAVRAEEDKPEPDTLGIALKAHMPPLASLPDRVAVLGIPVVVRRAA